jgi:indolepyruvate ferredoxin oxidoreductase
MVVSNPRPERTAQRNAARRAVEGRERGTISLDDKYAATSGRALMSGIQALVRLPLDQRRLDRARGLDTAVYVSGYPGSPLGGFDRELDRAGSALEQEPIVCAPGLNEELAATAVAGTQLIGELDRRRYEGVVGLWYGKNPGLDRAADAIRHGNVSGTAPLGGAVALIGDDPESKSSTLPSSSEPICRSLVMPLLAPGSVQELLELGLHAVALSRASGLWAGVKVVADIADASATVSLDGLFERIPEPQPRRHRPPVLLPPSSVAAERDQFDARLERATEYVRRAGLNEIQVEPRRPRLAIAAAGMAYQAVLRALESMDLGDDDLEGLGIRLVKISVPWPLDGALARRIATGVDQILVVEDKLPFLETLLKESLYGTAEPPPIVGKRDRDDRPLLPAHGALQADDVARALGRLLPSDRLPERARARLRAVADHQRELAELPTIAARTPYFCSGCPHNRSTRAPDDRLVGVGIGCHTMVALDEGGRGELIGMSQMGGEGAQWIGLEQFTEDEHFVQNLGDGTFHHSGSLAIRAAVAAGSRITFKLLYNDAVAMTGGQRPQGRMDVPTITRLLAAEGVAAIVITTPEPSSYRGVDLAAAARVVHRDRLAEVEDELSRVDGVTVLIHDDRGALEKRRLRKRGELEAPAERVWVNERVCEGCGDCGAQSTCLSVRPVETEFGPKTEIHQASCSQDFSCLQGDCPSFLLVTPGKRKNEARPAEPPADLPEPDRRLLGETALLRMPGVGGTGVVTVSQILQMAADLDGLRAAGLEQTGLAQKGGPVISDVRISAEPIEGTLRADPESADVIIGFDLLGAAAPKTLEVGEPGRTIAIVNTAAVPTAEMVTDVDVPFPPVETARRRIDAVSRPDANIFIDALALSERLFGDHLPANLLLLGAAYQRGCVPVSAAALERAIVLNGAAVEKNVAAFRWGRAAIARPEAIEADEKPAAPELTGFERELIDRAGSNAELRRSLEIRIPDLVGYQDRSYARLYADRIADFAGRVGGRDPDGTLAASFAVGLHKLMAYKDEYEVARLHLDAAERARLAGEFGEGATVKVLLHPPLLRALGLKRKLRLGPWILPVFRVLRACRRVRGGWFDPFGVGRVRRTERELITEYEELVDAGLRHLTPDGEGTLREILALPDLVRGYEDVKLANVERFRSRGAELVAGFSADGTSSRTSRGSRPPALVSGG